MRSVPPKRKRSSKKGPLPFLPELIRIAAVGFRLFRPGPSDRLIGLAVTPTRDTRYEYEMNRKGVTPVAYLYHQRHSAEGCGIGGLCLLTSLSSIPGAVVLGVVDCHTVENR